jgi:translocation and assembly module TamB
LGDLVKIEGFGLTTRIKGDLKAVYNNGRMQLFNELNLLDGVYQSYGQDLSIEKGQLLFNGNIENPGISLLAFRKATASDDEVIAYLRMTGLLKDPKVTVYSVPTKPENEALAYLLTGAPLNKAGGSSSALLASAAMYFGKDYLGSMASVVGIEEVDFKSTSVGDSSLILGKQVLPDLYVRYIMDVLTTQMVVAVEYKLTEQISIEARAGDTHSSDIKYRFEFD